MNFPKCKVCETTFNLKNFRPLILPKCGHTYCFDCIEKNIKSNNYMICPLDKIDYQEMRIKDFPLNKDMVTFVTKKKKICNNHKKCLDYFCLTDMEEICALCGLFGTHKDHNITTKDELKNINEKILDYSSEKMKGIIFSDDIKKFKNLDNLILNNIKNVLKKNKSNLLSHYNVK